MRRYVAVWMVVLGACGDPASSLDADAGAGDDGAIGSDAGPGPDARPIPADILEYLQSIEGMVVEEQPAEIEGTRFFVLQYQQPSDHQDPDGLWFGQNLTLLHVDRDAPMVLSTSGYYGSTWQSRTELTRLLGANQLRTEQRFFLPSRPSPADWTHLTIAQAAADHHRIVEALRPYYSGGKWVSTGASKGGMTSVYHRRFYPDDVDATVAYVAPISFGRDDPRYIDFLESVGTAGCRQALVELQREGLLRREAMTDRIAANLDGFTFDILGLDGALESAVIETPFAFWQYQGASQCSSLPSTSASDDALYQWLDEVGGFTFGADQGIAYFQPYYHQAFTQLGYPGVDTSTIDDLLIASDVPFESYLAPGVDATFDETAMPDIADWVASDGAQLMFIYGENDPWTAGAFDLGDADDSYLFIAPNNNHGSAIRDLTTSDRQQAYDILERWMGVTPMFRELAPGEPPEPRFPPRLRVR